MGTDSRPCSHPVQIRNMRGERLCATCLFNLDTLETVEEAEHRAAQTTDREK